METRDLDAVMAIEQTSFRHPWSRGLFLGDVRAQITSLPVVILVGDRIVGYATACYVLDEMHITNIAVHPEERRKGLGRRLLSHLLAAARARPCALATLEVRSSNQAAQALYRDFGFRNVAIRRCYYGDEDALVMLLELAGA
jgi:ribosomal-protein-alanine N-acetyltransferase